MAIFSKRGNHAVQRPFLSGREMMEPLDESMAVRNCRNLIARLQAVVDDENADLSNCTIKSHASYAELKNQLLRELMVAQGHCRTPGSRQVLESAYLAIRESIVRNERLLKMHLEALNEVSGMIMDSIRQADSDGTYAQRPLTRLQVR